MKIIVDTDVDFDDVIALIFLLKRPDVEIVAITITGVGMTYLNAATIIVGKLVHLSGRDIPIGVGGSDPIAPNSHRFPTEWRNRTSSILLDLFSVVPDVAAKRPTAIAEVVLDRYIAPDVTLLAIGPVTNIANILLHNPAIASRMGPLVVLGGSVGNHPGNVLGAHHTEYNIWLDPVAFSIVNTMLIEMKVAGDIHNMVSLVTLNVTDKVPIVPSFTDRSSPDLLTEIAIEAAKNLVLVNDPEPVYFWDVLAALIAVTPMGVLQRYTRWAVASISVDPSDGMLTLYLPGTGRIYYDVSAGWFMRELLGTLC